MFNRLKEKSSELMDQHNEWKEVKAEEREQFLEDNQDNLPKIFKATSKSDYIDLDDTSNIFRLKNYNTGTKLKKKTSAGGIALAIGTSGVSTIVKMATSSSVASHKKGFYKYTELISFELLEDDVQVTSGGLGRALVGGVALGGVGAIVGGVTGKKTSRKVVTNLSVKMTVNDPDNPLLVIPLITKKTKTKSKDYKNAEDAAHRILSYLELITVKAEALLENEDLEVITENVTTDVYEEIKKLKELNDLGIISDEDFETKKNELLGL